MKTISRLASVFFLFTQVISASLFDEFSEFSLESGDRASICAKSDEIGAQNPNKVQAKLIQSMSAWLFEAHPNKALKSIEEAITLYGENFSKEEGFEKKMKSLTEEKARIEMSIKAIETGFENDENIRLYREGKSPLQVEAVENTLMKNKSYRNFFAENSFYKILIEKFEAQ